MSIRVNSLLNHQSVIDPLGKHQMVLIRESSVLKIELVLIAIQLDSSSHRLPMIIEDRIQEDLQLMHSIIHLYPLYITVGTHVCDPIAMPIRTMDVDQLVEVKILDQLRVKFRDKDPLFRERLSLQVNQLPGQLDPVIGVNGGQVRTVILQILDLMLG